jgi:dephospho-CoA kinase
MLATFKAKTYQGTSVCLNILFKLAPTDILVSAAPFAAHHGSTTEPTTLAKNHFWQGVFHGPVLSVKREKRLAGFYNSNMGNLILILGITGSIASGKSSVAELFRKKGAAVLSADQLARELVEPGSEILDKLVAQFGQQILTRDGTLDRDALGHIVFSDVEARQKLNAILHPAIAQLSEQRLAELQETGARLVVYEAPLLFEVGAEKRVDKTLVVTVDPDVQVQRLIKRDNLDESTAHLRVAAQMSQQEKVLRADYLLDNSANFAALEQRVDKLWHDLGF